MSDRIEIYRATVRRKWRWRYVATNGNILADSGQGYSRRIDALTSAARVTCRCLTCRQQGRELPVVEVAK